MDYPIITTDNCANILNAFIEGSDKDTTGKVAAWRMVYHFCEQNGMKREAACSGIQSVINFIQTLINNVNKQPNK